MIPYLEDNFYISSLHRQLLMLLDKSSLTDEQLQDHLRLAVMDICIIFGLDGNTPFNGSDITEFKHKYENQLQDIRSVRNDLVAHSFDSTTDKEYKRKTHEDCRNILLKYKTPKNNSFTTDLITLCINRLENYEP